tara:strand:- start:1733 stop:3646 length:1914 start_codon:yes stop_codon:yes gene_type:complete
MERHSLQISRRLYPGQVDAIPMQLPPSYVSEKKNNLITGQNCSNCFFINGGKCEYWKAKVRNDYRCASWRSLTSTAPLPPPVPCLTGITVPILLTQDFNDIGVYTPFDGLAVQRDVLVNFVYTGNNNTITIFNTADLEFKKFLRIAPYDIDWGDGNTGQLTPPLNVTATHTYATPSSGYTITLSQINPWGTTFISKSVPIPYFNTPVIPNPFGNFSVLAPNIGDPIGCDSVTQDWIFWGDSNPDVYDTLSSSWVNTPFAVTGHSYTSQLNVLKQYGTNPYPSVGNVVNVGLSGTGVITTISTWYTAYTLNDINYIDYSGGTTAYSAMSMGLDHNNLDYHCCKEEEVCNCSEDPNLDCWILHMGMDCMTIRAYLDGGGGTFPPNSGTQANLFLYLIPDPSNPGHYITSNQYSPLYCSEDECKRANGLLRMAGGNSMKSTTLGSAIVYGGPQTPMSPLPTPTIPPVSNITPLERLFECMDRVCSEIPQGSWINENSGESSYSSLLAQSNMYSSLNDCNGNCGCTEIENLNLIINNVQKCSTVTMTNANGIKSHSFDCDGVVEIGGFNTLSSEYTITNNNTAESKTILPVNGQYTNIFFDNLCPSNYTNINGPAAGIYNFTILNDKGCTKQLSIVVETND